MLINNATYQREILSERPIRQPLKVPSWNSNEVKQCKGLYTIKYEKNDNFGQKVS